MNVRELISKLQEIEDKDLKVCVYDGTDWSLSGHIFMDRTRYWAEDHFETKLAVTIE